MVTEIAEELRLDDGTFRVSRDPAIAGVAVIDGARHFTLHLCRKTTQMGDIPIDQWWMKRSTLYGDRGRTAVNHQVIVNYWWRVCWKHNTVLDERIQENYILATILPRVRSNGARRVFGDAAPARRRTAESSQSQVIAKLDELLDRSRLEELDEVQFRDRTAGCLGPPEYDSEVREVYDQFSEELLGDTRAALERHGDAGLVIAEQRWDQWMRTVSRRSGHEVEKAVLDILSYECRAAFHQCYSAVWCDLLKHLAGKYEMSNETAFFHAFWHLEHRAKVNECTDAHFHLFHGHVFALHSAAGDFASTKTGSEMIGEWLKEGRPGPAFRRMLHGLLVAIYCYATRNAAYKILRKRTPNFLDEQGLLRQQELSVERKSGRRRPSK